MRSKIFPRLVKWPTAGHGDTATRCRPILVRSRARGVHASDHYRCTGCGQWVRIGTDGDGQLVDRLQDGRPHPLPCLRSAA